MLRYRSCFLLLGMALICLLISCEDDLRREELPSKYSESIAWIQVDDSFLVDTLKRLEESLVFFTTDWCGGGELTLNNVVLPKLTEVDSLDIPILFGIVGDLDKLDLDTTKLKNKKITIYKIEDPLFRNGLTDKFKIHSIIAEIDETHGFPNKAPLMIHLYQNRVVNEGSLIRLLEERRGKITAR